MEDFSLFTEISVLIAVAALVGVVTRLLKQPLVIGHIVTGLIVGPLILGFVHSPETLKLFSEIGIAFLLFIVGISLDLSTIRRFGMIAFVTGFGQMALTTAVGYGLSRALGFGALPSLYLGVALAFSSTIIIMKLISDKGDLEKLYAKISVGFLIVQDLIAILLLFFIPFISRGQGTVGEAVFLIGRGVFLTVLVFIASFLVLPRLNTFLSRSRELLFLFSIAWGIGLAALYRNLGFPLETGALIAGVALSTLPSRHEVSARLTPLRDFFIVLFFILLGSQMAIGSAGSLILPAIVLSALVLVGNPVILMSIMGLLGYRKRTSLQTGFTVAQISEFSFILVGLGVAVGHVPPETLSLVTLVGLVTIFGSTYLILYSDRIYKRLSPYLGMFERKHPTEMPAQGDGYEALLIGYNRIGYSLLQAFHKTGRSALVVDYNLETVKNLEKKSTRAVYGDASSPDFLDSLSLDDVRIVVSTVPDLETNLLILSEIKVRRPDAIVMLIAHQIEDGMMLYEKGADYVIMPHFLGGEYAARILEESNMDRERFAPLRERHIGSLRERLAMGHEHPEPERFRF